MLKFCYVGPLVPDSPNTQRKNSVKIAKAGALRRADSLSVGLPSTLGLFTLKNRLVFY